MMPDFKGTIILLAAGQSQRMQPVNKLLLTIDAAPLVRRMAEIALAICDQVMVVTGFDADKISAALTGLPVTKVFNSDHLSGHHSSVTCGLKACARRGGGVMILLGDQYCLTADHLKGLIDQYDRQTITIPRVNGQRGHPVYLPACHHKGFLDSESPSLRHYLDQNREEITWIKTENPAFIQDLDTLDDIKAAGLAP